MKHLLVLLLVAAVAFATQDASPWATGPVGGQSRADLTTLDSFDIEALTVGSGGTVYNVGLGYDGTNLWVTDGRANGGYGISKIWVISLASPHTLVTNYDQCGTTGWGLRDLCTDGTYMYGSDDTGVDYYNRSTGVRVGSYTCTAVNPNRAQAWDGTYFYTGSFTTDVFQVTWNGVSGSTATYTTWSSAIANGGIYGAAYDSEWPCMWVSTASADGVLYQLDMSGSLITQYNLLSEIGTAGGCEMAPFAGQSQLWVLSQGTPDMVYCFDVRTLALVPETWGAITTLF
jgi:hypothetical protein